MADVFISYKREELRHARAIAERLIAEGYSVWWDIDLLPGEKFASAIAAILDDSRATIVLWSKLAAESDFVCSEARRAKTLGTYVPVSLDGTSPPLGLDQEHCLSLQEWMGSADDSLLDPLSNAVRRRVTPAQKAATHDLQAAEAEEIELWKAIAKSRSPDQLRHYLDRYGERGLFSELAQMYLQRVASPTAEEAPPAPALVAPGITLALPPRFSHRSIPLKKASVNAVAFLPNGDLLVGQIGTDKDKAKNWEQLLLVTPSSGMTTPLFRVRGGVTSLAISPDMRFALAIAPRLGDSVILDLQTKHHRIIGDERNNEDCSVVCQTIWEDNSTFVVGDLFDIYRVTLSRHGSIAGVSSLPSGPFARLSATVFVHAIEGKLQRRFLQNQKPAQAAFDLMLPADATLEALCVSPDGSRLLCAVELKEGAMLQLRECENWAIVAQREFEDVTFFEFDSVAWIDDDWIVVCWTTCIEILLADTLRTVERNEEALVDRLLVGKIGQETQLAGWYTDEIEMFTPAES